MVDCNMNWASLALGRTAEPSAWRLMKHCSRCSHFWIYSNPKVLLGIEKCNRRARIYKITAAGRKQLAVETRKYAKLTLAIARVMGAE